MSAPAADYFFGALVMTTPAVIASTEAATDASGFSLKAYPSLSVMLLTNKGAKANAPASAPNFSFGAASLSSAATPAAPRVFAPASSQAFSFGTGMYQPRSRGGRASQPSDRYCSPPL